MNVMTRWSAIAATGALILGPGCPPPADADAAVLDGAVHDGAVHDGAIADRGPSDAGGVDSGPCTVDSRGFCIRVPQTRDVPWTDYMGDPQILPMLDVDFVCTLDYGSLHGFIYVQSRATTCQFGCEMAIDGAWISVGGVTAPITASYNWGGNHRNDAIRVNYDDKVFNYYHSSIGFGWRACHEPDCTQVYQVDGTTLIDDGCTMTRTLPQVCVLVDEQGAVPPLVDDFTHCLGDPNYDAG